MYCQVPAAMSGIVTPSRRMTVGEVTAMPKAAMSAAIFSAVVVVGVGVAEKFGIRHSHATKRPFHPKSSNKLESLI